MLKNIGQSLLHQSVQHGGHIGRQRIVSPERLNVDTNAITLLPFRNIGFDRPENSEIIDRRRPQVRRGAMNVTADLCRKLSAILPARLPPLRCFPWPILAQVLSGRGKPRHGLPNLIVQFSRNPPLLLFLGGSQAPKQMRPLGLRALWDIDVGQHAVNHRGSDWAALRPSPPRATSIPRDRSIKSETRRCSICHSRGRLCRTRSGQRGAIIRSARESRLQTTWFPPIGSSASRAVRKSGYSR